MAQHWHVARGKVKEGPFTLEQMKGLVLQGVLSPTDMVLQDGARRWTAAGTVEGLFDGHRTDDRAEGLKPTRPEPSLQQRSIDWLREQYRANPQRVLLVGGGAALATLFVVCFGCMGISGSMSGGRGGGSKGSGADDELTNKVTAQMRKVNAENVGKIRRGMTEPEVEAIIGRSYEKTNDVGVGYTKTYYGIGQSLIIIVYTGGRVDRVD